MHLCTENPCPLQDKECAEILKNGFKTHYVNKKQFKRRTKNICHPKTQTDFKKLRMV